MVTSVSVTAYKVLGQTKIQSEGMTVLYTVPPPPTAGSGVKVISGVIKSLIICNTAEQHATFQIAVKKAAGIDYFIEYERSLNGNETIPLIFDITLETGDTVKIRASNNKVTFSAFGFEVVTYTIYN